MVQSESRTVTESKSSIMELMEPEHANVHGNVQGGKIMKMVDQVAYIAASRHALSNVVTASADRFDFLSPVFVGNVVHAMASVNYTGTSSMEIGVRVEAQCLNSGKIVHVNSAYLTFVALDEKDNPKKVPKIIPETNEEKRRYEEAKVRKENRLKVQKKRSPSAPCMTRLQNTPFPYKRDVD
ncbi:MAG: acyl-CoA thioesterase [Candidatus Lokiarchaeota archaeon]|nr:acyl-CoA thioesterase [Candidatus Lokiarchaeota archaeon]